MNYHKWFRQSAHHLDDHVDEALLLRYFEGEASSREIEFINAHVSTCSFCMQLVSSYHFQSLHPADEKLLDELKIAEKLNPEAQLRKLFPAAAKKEPGWLEQLLYHWRRRPGLKRRWGFASGIASLATIALLLFFVGIPQYKSWKSHVLTRNAAETLSRSLFISEGMLRPSGGFEFGLFGRMRSQTGKGLTSVVESLQKALELNPRNVEAHEFLGTYYLYVESDLEKAESHYLQAFAIDSGRVYLLNDLGVLAWNKQKYEQARRYFEQAISHKPDFREARYNLAILLESLGETEPAIQAWKTYLTLDPQSLWADIARKHLKQLQTQE